MNRKLMRLALLVPSLVGLGYGTLTLLVRDVIVRASARCCSSNADCTGNQICTAVDGLAGCGSVNSRYCVSVSN